MDLAAAYRVPGHIWSLSPCTLNPWQTVHLEWSARCWYQDDDLWSDHVIYLYLPVQAKTGLLPCVQSDRNCRSFVYSYYTHTSLCCGIIHKPLCGASFALYYSFHIVYTSCTTRSRHQTISPLMFVGLPCLIRRPCNSRLLASGYNRHKLRLMRWLTSWEWMWTEC